MQANQIKLQINRKVLILFFLLFLLFGGLMEGVVFVFYQSQRDSFLSDIKSNEFRAIGLQSRTISDVFDTIVSDLLFLSEQNELMALLRDRHNPATLAAMEQEYLIFAARKKVYDQIRFLDAVGHEVVRVDYNNGHPQAADKPALQDKSKRYYFSDAFRLEQGKIFVSPMDLNIELGAVERPFKPVIRFGTPVFDASGHKRGIVLINYRAQVLLDSVRKAGHFSQGAPMLLNEQGYWLLGEKSEDEWGFMLEDRADRSFARLYSDEWQKILTRQTGQLQTGNGLFTFTTVYPLQEGYRSSTGSSEAYTASTGELDPSEYFWVVLSYLPADLIQQRVAGLQARLFLMGAGLFIVVAIGAWFLALAITKRRIYQNQLLSMALYDSLTGLPNRKLFFDHLEESIAHADRHDRRLGLLYIDLDGFKEVNDTMGHKTGDEMLVKVGGIMRSSVRKSDTVARLGGDEFAVIILEIQTLEDAVAVGNKIIAALSRPIQLKAGQADIGASIGAALYPETATSPDMLTKAADQAMYRSKARGKNTCTAAEPVP